MSCPTPGYCYVVSSPDALKHFEVLLTSPKLSAKSFQSADGLFIDRLQLVVSLVHAEYLILHDVPARHAGHLFAGIWHALVLRAALCSLHDAGAGTVKRSGAVAGCSGALQLMQV